ncbi:hypothetical protein D3C71_1764240 [compost metagenome]
MSEGQPVSPITKRQRPLAGTVQVMHLTQVDDVVATRIGRDFLAFQIGRALVQDGHTALARPVRHAFEFVAA